MTMEWYVTLFGFAVLTCGTPGPNNLMLTASGANFGVRRTLPHLLGVGVGQPVLQLVLALGLYPLFERWPLLRLGLQIFGSLYLLWLAWRIAVAGARGIQPTRPSADHAGGAGLSVPQSQGVDDGDLRHQSVQPVRCQLLAESAGGDDSVCAGGAAGLLCLGAVRPSAEQLDQLGSGLAAAQRLSRPADGTLCGDALVLSRVALMGEGPRRGISDLSPRGWLCILEGFPHNGHVVSTRG